MSESVSPDLSKVDCLDENFSDRLSRLVHKTENLQVRQCCIVATQAGYEKNQKEEKDYCGNKINPVVGKSNGTKASVYHHVIDQY